MKLFPITLIAAAISLAAPARAAAPLRLYEIGTVRFTERTPGQIWLERGLFSALGGFRLTDASPVLASVPVPAEATNKMLIQLHAWFAYERLGAEALVNFVADENATPYTVGLVQYLPVSSHPEPKLNEGRLINMSTRGFASTAEKLIGGFVVDEQHRWVLVRAIGPGLSGFGIGNALSDPYLTIYKGRTIIHYNGDWSSRPDASDIEKAGQQVGAFPLAAGSKDSALLVQLPPGVYTAHVEPETGNAGQALLEIYSIPDNS